MSLRTRNVRTERHKNRASLDAVCLDEQLRHRQFDGCWRSSVSELRTTVLHGEYKLYSLGRPFTIDDDDVEYVQNERDNQQERDSTYSQARGHIADY